MKLFYMIPIIIGFSIDIIDFGKLVIAFVNRKATPDPCFGTFSSFFLAAWGISGIMIFGKPPEEMMKAWDFFLTVLLVAFCVHLFIRYALPNLFIIMCNLYYGRKLLDMSSLPPTKNK